MEPVYLPQLLFMQDA